MRATLDRFLALALGLFGTFVGGVALYALLTTAFSLGGSDDFARGVSLFVVVPGALAALALLGAPALAAGVGLWQGRPWARTLAVALGGAWGAGLAWVALVAVAPGTGGPFLAASLAAFTVAALAVVPRGDPPEPPPHFGS